jgi:hypothetical protein
LSPAPPLGVEVVDAGGVDAVPPAPAPAPPEADEAGAEPVLPDEPEPEPELDGTDAAVVVLLVEVVVVVEALVVVAVVLPPSGTVSGGTPLVSAAELEPPPPQAARPAESATPHASAATSAVTRRTEPDAGKRVEVDIGTASGAERLHPSAAYRTVVQILLSELIAPVAEPEVLDRPRELRGRWSEWQQLRNDLERLAGVTIDVIPPRLGLEHDLPTGRRRAHTVFLAQPHAGDPSSGSGVNVSVPDLVRGGRRLPREPPVESPRRALG